jgi:catechol 2,3-dioxygenase-like lactoylglutathione lyase family enzyme
MLWLQQSIPESGTQPGGKIGGPHLHRVVTAQPRIPDQIDLAHATGAEEPDDPTILYLANASPIGSGTADAARRLRQNRAMKPAGVHHVAICVADAQKGLAFYRDVLGMTQLPRPDLGPGYWLDAGGQQVHLMESDTQPLGANHFAIRVDDIDAAISDLQEQGVEVQRIPFIPGAGHQAFLHDPFGNLLELNQPE